MQLKQNLQLLTRGALSFVSETSELSHCGGPFSAPVNQSVSHWCGLSWGDFVTLGEEVPLGVEVATITHQVCGVSSQQL